MWPRIKAFFKDSEVLFLARLQQLLGFVAVALTYVDPKLLEPVFGNNTWGFALFMLGNGVATEFLRRRRDPEMK